MSYKSYYYFLIFKTKKENFKIGNKMDETLVYDPI